MQSNIHPTLFAVALICLLLAPMHSMPPEESTTQPTTQKTTTQKTQDIEAERVLIQQITDIAEAGQLTRLHPEYVWETLSDRSEDEKLDKAFKSTLESGHKGDTKALINALELKFIHDPETSVLDLLGPELSEHFRAFDWQFGDYPGGPDGPNETFADVMVDALDQVTPERRANRTRNAVVLRNEASDEVWDYMTAQWVEVPGQEKYMLNKHAKDGFVKMHEAAKEDGVELIILSAHRTRKRAEANAARVNNPMAVASFSAHSLGLAVDFQMSHGDFKSKEMSTRPMAEVVRMRESPVHKWLHLRGHQFGWFPYQNEPWHWEYNPPGFRDIFWADFPGGSPARPLQ
jgi:uncharacterized protein YcbK (DUF882 family)